jgi:exopolyphosphatase / guanosine-5'-triphosphate,3'-diphosphate pyrophosphatase
MRLAAIDIGSNAVRLIVKEISGRGETLQVSKVAHTRVPIRLGEDVFVEGAISREKEERLAQTLRAFALLMEAMGVKRVPCARLKTVQKWRPAWRSQPEFNWN